MNQGLEQLKLRFLQIASPQDETENLFTKELILSPWATWLFICLLRHHERQQWVYDIVKYRLSGDPEWIAKAGGLAHPELKQKGIVPGELEWEYFFHGIGCCLTNRFTGESIDVDFHDDTADWFGFWFYKKYLESLKQPAFPEERLLALHQHEDALEFAYRELHAVGAIEGFKPDSLHPFKLSAEALKLQSLLERSDAEWNNSGEQLRVTLAVGDWDYATKHLEKTQHVTQAAELAISVRSARESMLLKTFKAQELQPESLLALHDLRSTHTERLIRSALAGPSSRVSSTALELLAEHPEINWCAAVAELLLRLNPNADFPEPHHWIRCAKYLLKQNYQREKICGLLDRFQHRELGEAALLALEYSPQQARELFRRALRSTIPYNVTTAAAALAILDETWCHTELIDVLQEFQAHENSSSIRSALCTSSNPRCHQAVHDWERQHPRNPETGPYITMAELTIRHADQFMNWEMKKLHDLVLPFRGKVGF